LLGPRKNIPAGELVRCSPIRDYVMVLVTDKRLRYVSDEDPTLTKVSSDLQHRSRLMARGGRVEYDGEEVLKVVVAERSSSSPYSRSDIEDSRCLLGAGEWDGDEMKGCRTSCCHRTSRTSLPLALVS